MREHVDPNPIEDEGVRQVVITRMNVVETLSAKVAEQAEEIRRLRDEIRRLKDEQGTPTCTPKNSSPLLCSEKERHQSTPHRKATKHAQVKIDRMEVVKGDQQLLPDDAQLKGYEDVIVQDSAFRTDTIRFRNEKESSPSHKKTDLAALPTGDNGQFGPGVKAWVLTLYDADGMSEPTILDRLHTVGRSISAGQRSDLLITDQEPFHVECAAVRNAGLARSPWHHLDRTRSTVTGKQEPCHILCTCLSPASSTLPGNDRLSLLRVLQGGADPVFQMNERAIELLGPRGVSATWQSQLPVLLPSNQTSTESQLDAVLDRSLPPQGDTLRKRVKEALASATDRPQTTSPVVALLLCDAAPHCTSVAAQVALWWIHDYRHDKKLGPRFLAHLDILKRFANDVWTLSRQLLGDRDHPCQTEAERLNAAFDQRFGQTSGSQPVDERKAWTMGKKDALLMVLSHPEILLHNHPAELGARPRVRKREVSVQARTSEGINAWDTFQTLVETARKLGGKSAQSFHDRISHTNLVPAFATLIQQRCLDLHRGESWSLTT